MQIVAEDALAEFPTVSVDVTTPCGIYHGTSLAIDAQLICAVSIIRSGDCLLEAVRMVEPAVCVGKILIQRDEGTALPKKFYSKLPRNIANMHVLLCDPMLATGGSAKMALDVLVQAGVDLEKVVFCNMICAPEGLRALAEDDRYAKVKIVTAFVDECLNEHKFIVPGLGDYGDRFFNTQD
jgi:uracil phosphoribosyltransferase